MQHLDEFSEDDRPARSNPLATIIIAAMVSVFVLLMIGRAMAGEGVLQLGSDSWTTGKSQSLTIGLLKPTSFMFSNGQQLLFTIKPDGQIERGPAFTTMEQASIEFWKSLSRSYPSFKEQVCKVP